MTKTTEESRRFVTPEEAARILDVSRRTVYRLLRRGDLSGRRVGAQWRIPAHALDATDDDSTEQVAAAV